jgi:cytochrome c553
MKILRILLVIGLLQNTHAQDLSGDIEKGEQLYYNFACYSCHGYNATMRVPLVGDASGIMSSEQVFLTYLRLRADQNPTNPKNAMPNYAASTLSDVQALDIYAYIKSLKDESPEVEDNPVMQEILEAAKARTPGDER